MWKYFCCPGFFFLCVSQCPLKYKEKEQETKRHKDRKRWKEKKKTKFGRKGKIKRMYKDGRREREKTVANLKSPFK